MVYGNIPLDWSLMHAVLAVAETGSLSGAAAQMGASQPTLGRQIRAAEAALGVTLFHRHARGLAPTPALNSLLPSLRRMEAAARDLSLTAAALDSTDAGRVRVTASRFAAVYILPPILAKLRQSHPLIEVDLDATDRTENLLFHEADIAVRMYRPEQLDMITRHLGDLELGLYATAAYIARRGRPETAQDLLAHRMIGYDVDDRILRGLQAAGLNVTREWFPMRTDDQIAYWELVCAGAGLGVGQVAVAETRPDLVRVLTDVKIPPLPVWLTAHERLRPTPRVARVWHALAEGLAPLVS